MSQSRSTLRTLSARITDFAEKEKIGSGKDCVIYRATWTALREPRKVVVKAYDRHAVSTTKVRAIKRESYDLLSRVPHVVGYYGSFSDTRCYYIVMELCEQGDLLEKILREGRAMEERRVVNEVAIPLLISLTALHKHSLIHRDIKLENIFVDSRGGVKFGDFGLTMSKEEERGISPVGTVEYMAPELCSLPPAELIISGQIDAMEVKPIDEKVDVWALGVTLYELLTGRSPFEGEDKATLKRNIAKYKIRRLPRFLSAECEDFLKLMLKYDAAERADARDLLQHPWIERHGRKRHIGVTTSVEKTSHPKTLRHVSEDALPTDQVERGDKSNHVAFCRRPCLSAESLTVVSPRRQEKFQAKLAKLLPLYRAPHEDRICMRDLWTLDLCDDDGDDIM